MASHPAQQLTSRLLDSFYTEAMLLADEARSYFDDGGRADRATLDPLTRVGFSCESLKVTTRLMHVIAFLLTRRAIDAGEVGDPANVRRHARKLGKAAGSSPELLARFPAAAQTLIAASIDLYARVKRLEDGGEVEAAPSPARALMQRLERSIQPG